jgi:putative intracellular protease/amidase/YHS domain-containing protein
MKKVILVISLLLLCETATCQSVEKKSIKSIAILLYEGFTPLDAVGPYQVLSGIMGVQVKTVAKKKGLIQSDGALALQANYSLSEINHADILIVPGGFGGTYHAAHDTAITNWVKKINRTSIYTTSVCTGAWILGAAGLLKDKSATTHWYGKELLESYGAHYKADRYVKVGKIYTAAGVSAGIDMALALLGEISGEEYSKAMQLVIEYDPQPPFNTGSVAKSDSSTVKMLRQMYDGGMQKLKSETTANEKDNAIRKQAQPISTNVLLLNGGVDPVCHMSVKKGSTITAMHEGKQYGFCSKMCKEQFEKEPKRFLPR